MEDPLKKKKNAKNIHWIFGDLVVSYNLKRNSRLYFHFLRGQNDWFISTLIHLNSTIYSTELFDISLSFPPFHFREQESQTWSFNLNRHNCVHWESRLKDFDEEKIEAKVYHLHFGNRRAEHDKSKLFLTWTGAALFSCRQPGELPGNKNSSLAAKTVRTFQTGE